MAFVTGGFFPSKVGLGGRGRICTHRQGEHGHLRTGRRRTPAQALFGRRPSGSGGGAEAQGFALADAALQSFTVLDDDEGRQLLSAPGAYAVRDVTGKLQYVGYARDVCARLRAHREAVPSLCAGFHTYTPPVPRADVTADLLEGVLEYWVSEAGGMPPGNTVDRHRWEGGPAPAGATGGAETATAAEPERVPVRERRTARRRSACAEGAATGYGEREDGQSTVDVDVDVDLLDPFTATRYARSTRERWESAADADAEDWLPIVGVVGVATVIWLLSVLGNTLPTAAPSMGL